MPSFIYKWSTERRESPKAKTLMPVSFVRPPSGGSRFTTCSVVPMTSATSLFFRPSATSSMTRCSRSLGTRFHSVQLQTCLLPVQQGSEFHSLDTASDSKTQKQPVEMGFYSSPCHRELGGDFGVVTTLQKQFNNLLFARTEPNGLILHLIPRFCFIRHSRSDAHLTFSEKSFLFFLCIKRPIAYQSLGESTRVGRHRATFGTRDYRSNWPRAILMSKSQFDWKRD